jgi:hypothetical protein
METETYRDCTICFEILQPVGTQFWNARGRIEYYEGMTFCSVNLTGSVNRFSSEEDAKRDFVAKAKSWADRRSRAEK